MLVRSAGRGRAAARSIRLALRSLSIVATSRASLPRWVLRCRGSRHASSASMPAASRAIPLIPIPAQPITGCAQHARSTLSTKLMDGKQEGARKWQSRGGQGPVAEIAATTGTDVATYTRERPGMSAFVLEGGVIYHTYSTYARGLDGLWGMYQWLDRAPEGRNETGVWWRRHDEYDKR